MVYVAGQERNHDCTYFAPGQQSWIMSVLGQLIIFCPRPKNISAPKQRRQTKYQDDDRQTQCQKMA